LANFFATLPGAPTAIVFRYHKIIYYGINCCRNYMDVLAVKQLALTLGFLAPGKPVYQVNVTYAAVATPATTGVVTVAGVKGNAAAAISSVLIGIFLVIGGSVAAYFGYQKFYAPVPVVKKPKKEEEKDSTNMVELQNIEEDRPESKRDVVDLEDV
jgi:hypothetical protein